MNVERKDLYVAEDDMDDQFLFDSAFRDLECASDYHVQFADNGQRLIELIDSQKPLPKAIFLDLNMPVKNGLECLQELRSKFSAEKLPVIIFSTSGDPELVNKTFELGANRYIQKPNDFHKLSKALNYCLCDDVIGKGRPAGIGQFLIKI